MTNPPTKNQTPPTEKEIDEAINRIVKNGIFEGATSNVSSKRVNDYCKAILNLVNQARFSERTKWMEVVEEVLEILKRQDNSILKAHFGTRNRAEHLTVNALMIMKLSDLIARMKKEQNS